MPLPLSTGGPDVSVLSVLLTLYGFVPSKSTTRSVLVCLL